MLSVHKCWFYREKESKIVNESKNVNHPFSSLDTLLLFTGIYTTSSRPENDRWLRTRAYWTSLILILSTYQVHFDVAVVVIRGVRSLSAAAFILILMLQDTLAIAFFVYWHLSGHMRKVFDGFHELLNEQASAERQMLSRNIRRLVVAAITAAALLVCLNLFQLVLSLGGFKHHWSQDIEGLNAWGLPQLAMISALLGPIITTMWCVSACYFNCCCAALVHLIERMSERLTTFRESSALYSHANQKEERKEMAECLMSEFVYYGRVIRIVKIVDKTFEVYAFLMLALNIPASVMILVKSFIGLHSSWIDFVINIAEFAYNFAGLLALTVLPARVHSLFSDVEENIHNNRHIWVPYDEEVYQVANVFVVQTRRPGLGLSLWGFTIVSKSLILKIGCAIITYLIVFIQLYPPGTLPSAANATLV